MQDIELAQISQEVTERFYNLLAVGEGGRCLRWVLASEMGVMMLRHARLPEGLRL